MMVFPSPYRMHTLGAKRVRTVVVGLKNGDILSLGGVRTIWIGKGGMTLRNNKGKTLKVDPSKIHFITVLGPFSGVTLDTLDSADELYNYMLVR